MIVQSLSGMPASTATSWMVPYAWFAVSNPERNTRYEGESLSWFSKCTNAMEYGPGIMMMVELRMFEWAPGALG